MNRKQTLLALGVLVVLSPFVGLPYAWLMWILPALGVLIVFAALSGRARVSAPEQAPAPAHETELSA